MATIAELIVEIGANSSGLRKELQASQRQIKRAFGSEALAFSGKAASLIGAIGAAISAVGAASVLTSAKLRASAVAFETLLGSAEKAKDFLDDLAQFAAQTPFEFEGLQDTAKKLLAFKFAAGDIIPIMSAIGDAAGMLGSGQEGIDRMTLAISQMQSKGKIQSQEMLQLAEAGVNAWQYLADSMGMSIADVMDKVSDGEVSSTQGINAIIMGMQKDFAGGMEKQSKEIPGLWSTIMDNTKMVLKNAGDGLIASLGIKEKLQGLGDFLSQFAAHVENVGIGQALKDLIPPGLSAAIFIIGGAIMMAAVPAMINFAIATWAAIAPMLPLLAIGAAVGALAWLIWKNWKPLGDLFKSLWTMMYNAIKYYWNSYKLVIFSAIKVVLSGISKLFEVFGVKSPVEGWLKSVDKSLAKTREETKKAGDGMKRGLEGAKGALKDIGTTTTQAFSGIGDSVKKLNTTFTGLKNPGAQLKEGTEETKKAYEQLQKKAEQVSESIRQEWVQTTKTELEQLDIWKEEQYTALEETKDANENYQRDIERVNAVYSARRLKILQQEAEDAKKIWDQAADSAQEYQRKAGGIGLKGVDKEKYDIETDAAEEIENIQRKYRDWAAEYSASTDAQKEQFRKAWTENRIQFEINEQGMVDFSKQADAEIVTAKEKMNQEIADLHYERTKWEEQLDEAYNEGRIERYKELLAEEQALEAQKIEGNKELMDEYYSWWQETHRTAASYMAETLNGLYGGLENFFVDIINNAKSIGDAWKSLKNSILAMLGQMVAKWISSQIMMAVFGKSMQATAAGVSAATAATTAAAWAPAAAMVSLATYGSNAAAAMAGIAATYGLSMGLAAIPGFASGGQIKGPGTAKSDSIWARLSDGEYVMQASAVRKFGSGFFDMLNMGQMPAFATGGLVTGPEISSGRYLNTPAINSREYEKTEAAKQERPPFVFSPTIQAMDAKSFKRWLDDGGGDVMVGWMRKAYGEFVPVGV